MKLLRTIVSTTVIAIGLIATTSIATANNHNDKQKHSRQWYNDQWKKNQNQNHKKQTNSYQNQNQIKKNQNKQHQPKVINKITKCKNGYRHYRSRDGRIQCHQRAPQGWSIWISSSNRQVIKQPQPVVRHNNANRSCPNGHQLFYSDSLRKYECFNAPRRGWRGVRR